MGVDHFASEEETLVLCKWWHAGKKGGLDSSLWALVPAGCRGISQVETDRGRTVKPSETQRSKVASVGASLESQSPCPQASVCPLHNIFLCWGHTGFLVRKQSKIRLPCPLPSDPIRCSLIQSNVSCIPKLEIDPVSFPQVTKPVFFWLLKVRKYSYLPCPYVCLTPSWSEICFR